ncbi:hypothetical protein V8D89_011398 [Ganoderma adspersum]
MASATSLAHEQRVIVSIPSDVDDNSATALDTAPNNGDSSSSPSASSSKHASDSLNLRPRNFVWGAKVIRNALPHATIPPWLDPLHVNINDPRKLPLCWYGVPFYSDTVFAYAKRIRLGVYLKHANLNLKPGDLDVYQTWPKLVKWFEGESGLTMHLHQVWGERKPLLTFFSNHEMARVTEEMWEITGDLLDDMDYPEDCKPMWYLDRRLDY